MSFTGVVFRNNSVDIDGGNFESCTFENVTLVYSGGAAPFFKNCGFNNINFLFSGAASNTMAFLGSLSQSPFRPFVENMFKNILDGKNLQKPEAP